MSQKTPRNFFKPLAIGAPEPMRDLPVKLERMIHFVPPHLDKVRAQVPDMAPGVDVILANLEDAIPADAKDAARAGAVEMAKMYDWQGKGTGFWSRVNCMNSPWFQEDVSQLVLNAGHQLDVIMLPKVEGPWDIHFADQYVAQLEAKAGLTRPILFHAILETAEGMARVEDIALASPRMQGISLGPADLAAADELDLRHARRGQRPDPLDADVVGDLADRERPAQSLVPAVDADALEDLDAILAAFGDQRVNGDAIARAKLGDVLADELLLELLNDGAGVTHGEFSGISGSGRGRSRA